MADTHIDTDAQATPVWEACKENVLPIKRGRSTKGLQAQGMGGMGGIGGIGGIGGLSASVNDSTAATQGAQGSQGSQSQAAEAVEAGFELELATAESGSQKLTCYIKHLKWVRDAYPSSSDKALALLERCTYELKGESSLSDDSRFIKVYTAIYYCSLVFTTCC
jgi:hypothetical protein